MIENQAPVVACIDNGGILRCRTGAKLLDSWGISAKPYAAQDVRKQTCQRLPPHVVALFSHDLVFDVDGEPVEQIPKDIAEKVLYFLVFCGLDVLPPIIKPDDPRICHKPVRDIDRLRNIDDYRRAMGEVAVATLEFAEDKFPHAFDDVLGTLPNTLQTVSSCETVQISRLSAWPSDWATMI